MTKCYAVLPNKRPVPPSLVNTRLCPLCIIEEKEGHQLKSTFMVSSQRWLQGGKGDRSKGYTLNPVSDINTHLSLQISLNSLKTPLTTTSHRYGQNTITKCYVTASDYVFVWVSTLRNAFFEATSV